MTIFKVGEDMSRAGLSYWSDQSVGRPREITVGQLLGEAVQVAPEQVAVVETQGGGTTWSYASLLEEAERGARALLNHFQPGDRVAIWAPNSGRWIVLQQALALAGLVAVPLNPAYRERELVYALRQSQARGLFYASSYRGFQMQKLLPALEASCPQLVTPQALDEWEGFLASGDPATQLPQVHPQDPFAILYTSGTTGKPKGALLHHMGVLNQALLTAQRADFQTGDVWINAMPLYHMAGGGVTTLGVISYHGTQVVMPQFDAGEMLDLFEQHHGSHALLVPTMLIALLEHLDHASYDLNSIKTIMSGAANVPAELVEQVTTTFACDFSILYGQAETHGVISQTTVHDTPTAQALTIGKPLPWIEVKVADIHTGETLPTGQIGEIHCRGYQNMLEYFQMPDATAETITSEGWLRTGDLGTMDAQGYLKITGRSKEMIIRGGLNIYPREIEDVLFSHPNIADVAVLGIPDERWGEQIAAVIRLNDGENPPTPEALKTFCTDRIARHKCPVYWYFVEEFPLTPTGKIQKFELKKHLENNDFKTSWVKTLHNL